MYRSNISTENNYKFGVELEFSGVSLRNIYDLLIKTDIPFKFEINHKSEKNSYDKWILDTDSTVTKQVSDSFVGGELSSRILTDDKQSWDELKIICNTLRTCNAKIDGNCSTHINVDISRFRDNAFFFEVLYKLLIVYENDIELFFQGDYHHIRKTKYKYAKSMFEELLGNISKMNFDDPTSILYCTTFRSRDGISLSKFSDDSLIEVRYPNGSLSEKTIQNYINFTLKLIDAIGNNKFDLEYLNYYIKRLLYDYDFFVECALKNNNIDLFYQLVEIISSSDEDKIQFIRQYKKVINKKK